jgi:hypothetical protein
MEFLMTYGWAILVVLAAIGALAYFGVLSPDRFLPEKCTMTGGFSCTEYLISDKGPGFRLQNNLGVDASIVRVDVTHRAGSSSGCPPFMYYELMLPMMAQVDIPIANGESIAFRPPTATEPVAWRELIKAAPVSCTIQGKYKGNIKVTYKKSGETVTHIAEGEIVGRVG